jgi:hypothetical protein
VLREYFSEPEFLKILLGMLPQENIQQLPVYLVLQAAGAAHDTAFPAPSENETETPAKIKPPPAPAETFGGASTLDLLRRST